MGTLTAPPTAKFLTRIVAREDGRRPLPRKRLAHPLEGQADHRAAPARRACTRGEPLLIALDQEGGIVKRLAWAPPTEAPADMQSPTDAHAQAEGTAAALRESGVDIDFAPVVDTPSSPSNFLGSRAFSRNAKWNAAMAKAFVRGLQQNGIAATAKHFPGLGLAGGNTDHGRITINAAKWKIEQGLRPFQAAIKAGVKLVMVNTAIYPHLDASRPAGGVLDDDHQRDSPRAARLQGRHGHRLAHVARPVRDPARGDEGDARRLRPAHLGQGVGRGAGLRDAHRRRAGLGCPPDEARGGGRPDPRAQDVAHRARRPELRLRV